MSNKRLISAKEYEDAILAVLQNLEQQSGYSIKQEDLGNLVITSLEKLREDILPGEITTIIDYSISEFLIHWKAILKLFPDDSMSLHCRKILECSLIVQFLINSKADWAKYLKKWELYREVTMFARWSKFDRNNLHPETQKNINLMCNHYSKKYKEFEIFFSSKKLIPLTGDLLSDLDSFSKIKSWISPRSFEDLLADRINSGDQSQGQFYGWWSNSVHFSPLNQGFQTIKTEFGDFSENAFLNIYLEVSSFIKCLSKFTMSEKYYFHLASSFFYFHLLNLVRVKPLAFFEQVEKHPQAFKALIALAAGQIDASRYVELAIPKK